MADSRPQWLAALRKLAASAVPEDVKDNPPVVPTFGTVRSLDPLRIALDSDPSTVLPYAPACLDFPTFVGQRVWVQTYGRQVVVVGVSKAAPDIPVGTGSLWTGPVGKEPPPPWMLAEGQLLRRTEYPELSALYGSTFTGSNATYVALPDARGRTVAGRKSGSSLWGVVGGTPGAETHTLTVDEMPTHTHDIRVDTGTSSGWLAAARFSWGQPYPDSAVDPYAVRPSGGGQPHNNVQPSLTLRYMVKVR